ncbi:class I SAM-dependent methyltransferase [Oxalobacter formigenes]|nr:class I SAM-dependent methyltransferase [Oxalobacter formigenes]ARQ45869.1 putative methyltransferase YcgJ [Oxalobacter formigenes]ARQ78089.1 hypothetical protein BRW84_05280 [Oxalobacter formigenes OXCC13]MCZ4062223.1 class I SAM-dependent methyltransferase [Oxalobacter formigenes]QDX33366.1 class I SAM-dependent methyltransferase [Oxalobacter formigenes]WAW02504.1 class I SAM-dependent methyltransferase [Oxalobacter formigenes]
MKPTNIGAIHLSFGMQAEEFEKPGMNFSNRDYLDYCVRTIEPASTDSVLEVAAGTCACGRSLAPFAQTVTCLDTTPAMLEVGKKEAEKNRLNNMVFIKGQAEELPFPDSSFDIVISRLAFHHFPDTRLPFQEMTRVLKTGGKLVLIDMEAPEEPLRATRDKIESMRDPSHVKNLNQAELLKLFADQSLSIIKCEKTKIPVSLQNWLELTKTPDVTRTKIMNDMKSDMNGQAKTGFSPYLNENDIFFYQNWIMLIGKMTDA